MRISFIIILFFLAISLYGSAAFNGESSAKINIQTTNGVDNYQDMNGLNNYSSTYGSSDYFHLKASEAWVNKNNGSDITGVTFHYRIYKQGEAAPSFSTISCGWQEENGAGTVYQKWGEYNSDIDILAGVNSSGTWVFECFYDASTNGVDAADPVYLNNGASNYSFTFIADASLPVELTSFSAAEIDGAVKLTWETATEIDNYGFEVERSVSISEHQGQNNEFETIGFMVGHGNSNSPKQYEFIDTNAPAENLVYRLKQIDTDGTFEYFSLTANIDARSVTDVNDESLPIEFELKQNYPNPFNPNTTIKYSIPADMKGEISNVSLVIYDVLGNEVKTLVNKQQPTGIYEVNFDASNLTSGVYVYKLQAGNQITTKKMMLLK